jgi:hypothetical protein
MTESHPKRCTDALPQLDVRALARDEGLEPGTRHYRTWSRCTVVAAACDDSMLLTHRRLGPGGWGESNYTVGLTWTPCHLGGRRAWWHCPVVGCGRRVAILYGGLVFACRQCHRLGYRVELETEEDRAARRANKLRQRLEWVPGVFHGVGPKPKGMHWRTYWRLRLSYHEAEAEVLQNIGAQLGRLRGLVVRTTNDSSARKVP